jgi:hypothetical protein
MTIADIAAVQHHLAMLRINDMVPTRQGILQKLLDANGAPATAMNLATAQDLYFRGMWMALSQSERRYGGHIVEADDFIEQVFKDRVRPAQGGSAVSDANRFRPAAVPDQAAETELPDRHTVDDRFKSMSDLLIKKRLKEKRWTTKSKDQAEQIFTLMTRFMKEERSIDNICNVRQKDMAAFNSFLETDIYKHHGKSEKDKHRSIAEMRLVALSKPENLRGLETGTPGHC